MSRDIASAADTALQQKVVHPVLIGRLDIQTDPVIAWTGPGVFAPTGTGDAALDGQTFAPLAPFVSLTNILEDQGIGGPTTLSVAGHDLDETLLKEVIRDTRLWQGRDAWLWMGLLDTSDEHTVVADPIRIKTGVMTNMQLSRDGENSVVNVTIDRDLGNARSAPFRWVDHPRIWSTDTWSTYIISLANRPQGFEVPLAGDIVEQRPNYTSPYLG